MATPIFTDGLRLEGDRGVTDYAGSFGAQQAATASQSWADSPISQLFGIGEMERAKGNDLAEMGTGEPSLNPVPQPAMIDKAAAAERVKAAGLEKELKLPDQDLIASPALDIMISRARAQREREATIARGPQNIFAQAAGLGTSFLVGAVDPLNLASALIPVVGEMRYGKILASAGDSLIGRTGVRAGVGAAQGVVGQAAIEPIDWYAHTQDGRDFGMADVLHNLVFGAALGGGLHAAGGGIRDVYRARKGLAQYPFGPGEPLEHVDGTHVPESVLAEGGVTQADMPEHLHPLVDEIEQLLAQRNKPPALAILQDLPPRAQEDSMRAAIASIVAGEPVKVGELLHAAAQTDPRIAESFDAWHGSPHNFERFDLSQIGTGEGAQAYGHGLYFAENERVARGYQRSTTGRDFIRKAQELYDEFDKPDDAHAAIAASKDLTEGQKRLLLALEKDDWLGFDYPHQAVSAALSDPHGKNWEMSPETIAAIKSVGNMYKVNIKADREHFLDWDKPFNEQSAHVQRALREHPDPSISGLTHKWGHDMPALYGRLSQRLAAHVDERGESWGAQGPSVASKALRDAGIPGIKYLDKGSRGAGEGTRNFVVFDDKHIEIVERNGQPVAKPFTESPAGNPKITLGDPDLVSAPKPRGRAAAHPDTLSLNEHLASKGGLKPDPELGAIYGGRGPFVPGFGPLVRKGGMALDEALRSATDHGYMFDPHAARVDLGTDGRTSLGLTPRDLLDHLDNENRGQKLYKAGHLEATRFDPEQEKHVVFGHVEAEFEAAGLKVADIDGKLLDRTVEIVHREGERDVLAAYERAIIEDADRYEAIANARDAATDHPARGVPDDAGAAPGRGGPDPADGGPARRAGPGERAADGAQPSRDGVSDRRAAEQSFRDLSQTQPEIDAPAVLEASRAADKLPEQVETSLDKRVTAADKADAYAKQMYDMFSDRLTEPERQRLDDLIRGIDDEAATRREAIERSGACLFGARA